MTRGIRLFRISGIWITVDYTWFIVFVVFAWSLSYGYFPSNEPGLGRAPYILMGVSSSLLLFACVLVHELAHSITSNRLGLTVKNITLFIFGGVAELTKEPDDPKTELKIAVAGPIASAALALFFYFLSKALSGALPVAFLAIFKYLALINIVIAAFNLIPGFPLDGGRVLRAVWWARTGDIKSATRAASRIGRGFAIFLILTGFAQIFTGNIIGGLWSIMIGVFLQQAAQSGYRELMIKTALEGLRVRDVMSTGVISMEEEITVAEAVERYFLTHHYASFPVVSKGKVAGLLQLSAVRTVPKEDWGKAQVRDVMHRISVGDALSPEDSALDAIKKMSPANLGRFPVVQDGTLVGIITRSDIMRMLEITSSLRDIR
ncbi:MAG: site-2 protease family protein [Deltaproteobacteria bacterium]|nr:site-2 protease family protein [Deltaproteobacteria bacterium]